MSKISAYTNLASAAPNDELVIVDVDDTTMAASGTTKRIAATAIGVTDWINVLNPAYGADPTGVADSTTAINNAIAAAVSAGGGVVYLPMGTYKISSTLTVGGHNVTLQGDGAGDNFSANLTTIHQTSTSANGITVTDTDYFIMKGIAVTGPGSGTGKGVAMNYTGPPCIFNGMEDVFIGSFGSDGLYANQPVMCTFTRVWAANNGNYGFNITGSGTSCTFNSCWARNNTSDGWYVNGNYMSFNGCGSDINAGRGWQFNNCQSCSFTGCGSELNTGNGIWLTNSCYGMVLAGAWVYNKAIGLLIDASCYRTTISGFVEVPSGSPTASIQIAAGAIATVIQPQVTTATNYLAGGAYVIQILDNSIVVNGVTLGAGASLDTTASHIQPDGTQAAGSNGLAADSGHVHPEKAWDTILAAPSGALVEAYPRLFASSFQSPTSGTVYVMAIPLPKGTVVGHITMCTGNGAETGGSHGWYALLDSGGVVRAVSVDQTGNTWSPNNSLITVAMASPYTVTTAGTFYLAVCITATGMPNFPGMAIAAVQAIQQTPILCGTAGTASTPPTVGTTLTITSGGNALWGYVS